VASGSRLAQADAYWAERDHRQQVLDNYKGSIFLIHGLQDWNVDPHSAIPFNQALHAKGIEMKEWYGQWQHAFPDSNCVAPSPEWYSIPCRLDFAEVLGRWLDHYLKGNTTAELGPALQVEDNIGFWRNADSFPPANPAWMELHLTAADTLSPTGGPEATVTLDPPTGSSPASMIEFKSEPLTDDLHFSGLAQLRLPFAAKGQGGEIAAWLFDEQDDGKVRAAVAGQDPVTRKWMPAGIPIIAHSQMNLLYANGGEDPQPIVPNERRTARIEFEPSDVLVPKGHRLSMWVFQYAYPDHLQTTTLAPVDIFLGGDGAVLRLPVSAEDATQVFPVPGVHFPDRAQVDRMAIDKPVFSGGNLPGLPLLPMCDDLPPAAQLPGACNG